MSVPEREAFLAGDHVAVISVAEEEDDEERAPFAVPIWYLYEPGGLVTIVTGGSSRKARLMRRAGRFSLVVQQETPPYRYVSVEGPIVEVSDPVDPADLRAVYERYMGPERAADVAATASSADGTVAIKMRPERWRTEDYGPEAS